MSQDLVFVKEPEKGWMARPSVRNSSVDCVHAQQICTGPQGGQGQARKRYCGTRGNEIYQRGNKDEMNNEFIKPLSPW